MRWLPGQIEKNKGLIYTGLHPALMDAGPSANAASVEGFNC